MCNKEAPKRRSACVILLIQRIYGMCFANNKIYRTLYCKFHINNWFSQKALVDFCRTPVFVARLRLQLTNERKFLHESCLIFSFTLMGKKEVKQRKRVCWTFLRLSVIGATSLLHQIIVCTYCKNTARFFFFWCYLQCNSCRQSTLLSLRCIMNILSVTFF